MCKRHVCIALVVLALPALTWADLLHPSISPIGLPILNSNTTGQSANVQVTGFFTQEGSNQAVVTVNSSQVSYNGLDGSSQTEESNLSVDYSGTGSVQVNEGGLIIPGLIGTSTLGLGSSTGMTAGTSALGTLGLNSAMLNANMIGMQTGVPTFIGQPVMIQAFLP